MKIDFHESEGWILPVEGTIGAKAQNLLNNTPTIISHGLKVPRSLVIPYEYLQSTSDPEDFALSQIDKFFPNWKRAVIRSSASEEDVNSRFPGQFMSDSIWHKDRWYAPTIIEDILYSYNLPAANYRRKVQGIERGGMSLLVQEPVCNSVEMFDANASGSFSDFGDECLLTITNSNMGLDAMNSPALRKIWINEQGEVISGDFQEYTGQGKKLKRLTDALGIDSKGWEIEFVENNAGLYVVQTTPISRRPKVQRPDETNNIFHTIDATGSGSVIADGILYVPHSFSLERLVEFDLHHKNYCLATVHSNIASDLENHENILNYLANSNVILDLTKGYWVDHPLAVHVQQFMRQNRISLGGFFEGIWDETIVTQFEYSSVYRSHNPKKDKLLYSPTQLYVEADERKKRGLVSVIGDVKDFEIIG